MTHRFLPIKYAKMHIKISTSRIPNIVTVVNLQSFFFLYFFIYSRKTLVRCHVLAFLSPPPYTFIHSLPNFLNIYRTFFFFSLFLIAIFYRSARQSINKWSKFLRLTRLISLFQLFCASSLILLTTLSRCAQT